MKRIAILLVAVSVAACGAARRTTVSGEGINGIDYHKSTIMLNPGWVEEAHRQGMSVNCRTVNKESEIRKMIDLEVDAITTNEPLLVRKILGEKEF